MPNINNKCSFPDEEPDVSSFPTPFTCTPQISNLQYLKMVIISVILLPCRVLLSGFFFVSAWFVSTILTRDFETRDRNEPITNYKRWLMHPIIVYLARLVYFFGGFHWVTIKGKRASRQEAPILVCGPHSTFLDTLVVVVLGLPSVVGKTESSKSCVGGLINILQPVLVNREDPNSRKTTIKELIYRTKSNDDWPQIIIFPEGTCTNRTCLIQFKAGAFVPGVPVQPVAIRWPNKIDSVTWVNGGPSVWKLLWMNFAQFHNRLEIEFLPVYKPSPIEQSNAQLYADNVCQVMSKYLNIPQCCFSCDDYCRIKMFQDSNLPEPEALAYLYSLLRVLFENDEKYEFEYFDKKLDFFLEFVRHKPLVTYTEFSTTLHENSKLSNSDQTYAINTVSKCYYDNVFKKVNFRTIIIHSCMLLFLDSPKDGLYKATQAYHRIDPPKGLKSKDRKRKELWPISVADAEDLLSKAFKFSSIEEIRELLNRALTLQQQAQLGDQNGLADTICSDFIYETMVNQYADIVNSYKKFNEKQSRVSSAQRSSSQSPLSSSVSTSGDKPCCKNIGCQMKYSTETPNEANYPHHHHHNQNECTSLEADSVCADLSTSNSDMTDSLENCHESSCSSSSSVLDLYKFPGSNSSKFTTMFNIHNSPDADLYQATAE